MECLPQRLQSFSKPVRVQNTSKPGTSKNIKWPHPESFLANPTSLAEAGFYYNPSFDDKDNVSCFTCEKQLSDWEVDDDPFDIHWSKCAKTCSWALLRCGLRQDMDAEGRFIFPDKTRLPTTKFMERVRLQTYSVGAGWVHDQTKNHGASSKKMAKAGFIYTPQHEGDDLAICLYCGVSLSDWDAGDNPMEEHRKRKADQCPLFLPPPTMAGSNKGRSTSGSSRASTRMSTAAPRSHTRGQSRSEMQNVAEENEESTQETKKPTVGRKSSRARKTVAPVEEEPIGEVPKVVKPRSTTKSTATRKPSRSRKTIPSVVEEESSQPESEPEAEAEAPAVTKNNPSRKSMRPRKTTNVAQAETKPEDEDDERPAALTKSTISKKPSRLRKVAGPEEEEEMSSQPTHQKPKPGSKSAPRNIEPIAPPPALSLQSTETDDEIEEIVLPKKSVRSKKPAVKPAEVNDDGGDEMEELIIPKKSSKSKKAVDEVKELVKSTKRSKTKSMVVPDSESTEERILPERESVKTDLVTETDMDISMEGPEAGNVSDRGVEEDRVEIETEPETTSKMKVDDGWEMATEPGFETTPQPAPEPEPPLLSYPSPAHPEPAAALETAESPTRDPQTPPPREVIRETGKSLYPGADLNSEPIQDGTAEFIPHLSKLPFVPLHSLSEAELDMSVEEWIRYQMEVEYDKFKRDGERELLRFRNRSEEVRKIIEGL